jgi:quercetin dioxygenase-like cupin family protein
MMAAWMVTMTTALSAGAAAAETKVTPLMARDLVGSPGKEATMITVEYPPGWSSSPHRHDAQTFVYVLEGSVVMAVQGGKEVTLGPGETFYESPDDVHSVARNAERDEAGEVPRVHGEGQGQAGQHAGEVNGRSSRGRYCQLRGRAGVAAVHHLERALEVRVGEPVRDHGLDVEPVVQHDRHLVPGLVHLPAVDALDGQHAEDHGVPVDGHLARGDPQHGDLGPVGHVREHVAEGLAVARHLHADVEPLRHPELLLDVGQTRLARVDGEGDAHLPRQLQPVGVQVRDHDVRAAAWRATAAAMMPMGPGAGDEDVFAQDGERQRGVHGVAEGSKIAATSSSIPSACTQTLLMGSTMYSAKAPARLTPTPWVSAQRCRRPARQLRHRPAHHVPFPAHDLPGLEVGDVGARPPRSRPRTRGRPRAGTGMVLAAHSSHL